ncbi:MAG: DUF192 domain-containing protein [Flavobacteriaceae bacterium]|nr:DUF192 domain-containing protein [Flavobacteriaceae bacterium]
MKIKLWVNLCLISFVLGLISCNNEKSPAPEVNNTDLIEIEFLKEGELSLINNSDVIKELDIEIAKSENERAIGLMNRSKLEENQAMLFIFEQDNSSGFYMKDTRIPLDIIFLGADSTVISISKNRRPFDLNSEGASSPYRFVLEINGGKSDDWGIEEGVTKIHWTETR